MVDIRELRLGNFFKTPVCNKFRVDEIYKDERGLYCVKCDIGCNGSYIYGDIKYLQPIPLTEELLLKCGFEKKKIVSVDIEHKYIYHHKEFGFISCNFAYCINDTNDYSEYDDVSELSLPLKHLHQLQNIYFDFTGKELEINL